ncbi:hypothetical protein Leryth_019621 [Lithospermum erythrorhizon]|nr:hypothetical protein Leryth_019621 [Lithospermum erythrorhizon]
MRAVQNSCPEIKAILLHVRANSCLYVDSNFTSQTHHHNTAGGPRISEKMEMIFDSFTKLKSVRREAKSWSLFLRKRLNSMMHLIKLEIWRNLLVQKD